tara:strand:+ start:361 stop:915 length:555 start_codon:yes stop_codon:yes gene_type:complete
MIFETIISTINEKGNVNFAPFGVKRKNNFIFISPYIPSTTLNNLIKSKQATINYIDDSAFFVNCIIGKKKFQKKKCNKIQGYFLKEALAHDEVLVESMTEDKLRPTFKCRIIEKVNHKRFEGYNRARNSLIEACILASRVKILEKKKILDELNSLTSSIIKTAGIGEKKSWNLIKNYILNATKK